MDRAQLLDDLLSMYDDRGLKQLCRQMRVPTREIAATDRRQMALNVINYLDKNGRLSQLAQVVQARASSVESGKASEAELSWIDQVASGKITPVEELPTLKWPSGAHKTDPSAAQNDPTGGDYIEEGLTMTWPSEVHEGAVGKNPYIVGSKVVDNSMFFGRISESQTLSAHLQDMNSCSVVGMPFIGKSSLLYHISHHEPFPAEKKMLFAYLDLNDPGIQSASALHNAALAGWFAQLLDALPPTAPTMADFSRHVRTIKSAGFRPVLCLDGFDALLDSDFEIGDDVIGEWKRLAASKQLAFAITLRRPLTELTKNKSLLSDFDTVFHQIVLGLLDKASALKLLTVPISGEGLALDSDDASQLLALCGRHPHFLQMAAYIALEWLLSGEYSNEKVHSAFKASSDSSWSDLWNWLSPLHQNILAEPFVNNPPLVISRQYRALAQLGVLVQENDQYHVFSQEFGRRIRALAEG